VFLALLYPSLRGVERRQTVGREPQDVADLLLQSSSPRLIAMTIDPCLPCGAVISGQHCWLLMPGAASVRDPGPLIVVFLSFQPRVSSRALCGWACRLGDYARRLPLSPKVRAPRNCRLASVRRLRPRPRGHPVAMRLPISVGVFLIAEYVRPLGA